MGVAVSKISMLTHCQALTQACNYCEGESRCSTVLITLLSLNYQFYHGHQAEEKKNPHCTSHYAYKLSSSAMKY